MREIKYRYCLDKDTKELIYIGDLTQETRYAHTYECLECGKEMEANMGSVKRRYFSHKSGCACDGESYLHKLAKRIIKARFESSEHFPIVFKRDIPCSEFETCMFKDDYLCKFHNKNIPHDLKIWKGKTLYNLCQEEVWCDEFKPDLLLTSTISSQLPPIFIEVYKTHESSDDKVNSKHKIIETYKLKSESDVDSILENGFVENVNCRIIGFNPKTGKTRKTDMNVTRVVVYETGVCRFYRFGEVKCGMLNVKYDPKSKYEFNVIPMSRMAVISPRCNLLPQQIGLAWAEKKGMKIRNCMLCNSYRYNEWYGKYMCISYKKLGQDHIFPKPSMATTCVEYRHSFELERMTIADLQRFASEVLEDIK